MKTDVRTSVALLLFAVSASAMAQGPLTPPQPDAQPPQPSAPPQATPPPPPPPVQNTAPVPQNTTPAAERAATRAATRNNAAARAARFIGTAKSATALVSAVAEIPVSLVAAVATAPAIPDIDTGDTRDDAPPPARQYGQPQWVHSESTVSDSKSNAYGFQYHPLVFHVDGGATITQRFSENYFNNGWNAGGGLTWYPTSQLPLGLRIDGTYNEFGLRNELLQQASQAFNTTVDRGTQKMWGGDADLELDLHLSPYMRAYLLGGGGLYRQQTTYRDTGYVPGFGCGFYGCGPGYFRDTNVVAREESGWHFAPNAGFGLEFYLGPRTSFFAEARYMRLNSNDGLKWDYIPVKFGLRF